MPVFTTETVYFDGEQIKLQYKVDARGVFSLKLPASLVEKLGCEPEITNKQLEPLKYEWVRLYKEYQAASTTTKKVIAWKLELNAEIYQESNPHQPVLKVGDISVAEGLAFSLVAGVFAHNITITGSKKNETFQWVSSDIPSSIEIRRFESWDIEKGLVGIMDWTLEREQFFVALTIQLENLILRLHKFLGSDKKSISKLTKLIDAQLNLLTAGDDK